MNRLLVLAGYAIAVAVKLILIRTYHADRSLHIDWTIT